MRKHLLLGLLSLLVLLSLSGIASAQGVSLIFWSTEEQPERARATQAIIDRFTEATGIGVSLVLTNEDILDSLMAANLAAGTLPDVMFHPVDYAGAWYADGILSSAAATQVITELGVDNFSALGLVGDGMGGYISVPTDGWGQLLIYRRDLFEAAGLAAPTDYASIRAAAEALHDPDNNFYGIVLATDPAAVFTQQTFEHFALANGVQLTDDAGVVTLNTPAMVEAIGFYADLVTNFGPPGVVDVPGARATYFAGQAAMVVWSPFILDEMAGLRDNALPNCAQCLEDPAYLARNSGFVPAFVGPSGSAPAQYGQVSMMGISTSAPAEAVQFVQFWLSEGYLDWLAVAPEGKFPMRRGTADNPTLYLEGWSTLPTGVDRRAPLGDFYSQEVINTIAEGATNFSRWGLAQGQGRLVGGVYQELVVPVILNDVINGVLTAEQAAAEIQTRVEEIQAAQAEQ
ncbi:MAG: extracellular solute-binding protein [Chloroflexi bacterium]|nr:extracellular solute-binding protein [Chloroflexota bacterium]